MTKITYNELKNEILNNPTIHDNVKAMVRLIDDKDAVDTYYDAKLLFKLCALRLNEILPNDYKTDIVKNL